jgi:hypothetical protein
MDSGTRTILDELYAIDPSLREREPDLQNLIERLSGS